ncbi:hypothetical protein PMAYCL1PPCAC_16075, partial [Pristionchus mayeri]
LTSIYCACFTVPFTLLCIHFLYRFWSVRLPHLIPLFSNWKCTTVLVTMMTVELILWFILTIYGTDGGMDEAGTIVLREAYNRTYGRIIKDGWLNGHFQLKLCCTLIALDIVMMCMFTFALTLASLTFHHIKHMSKISLAARHMQWKLFVAVCAQTFVSVVLMYIPHICVLNAPLFRISIHPTLVLLSTPIISCFPAWDALIIILIIKDYRVGMIEMIRPKATI